MAPETTRRALMGGAGLAAVAMIAPAVALVAPSPGKDAALLAHWEGRQRCYSQMVEDGTYYDSLQIAPALVAEHDDHETQLMKLTAQTPEGALAQAWVAWESQVEHFNADDRVRAALIHAADFNTLEAIERRRELDWDDSAMLAVIRSLRALAGQV